MPVYSSSELIPFVNELEGKINDMVDSVKQWDAEKYKLIPLSSKVETNTVTSTSALIRADEAMSEIGTATFRSTANRGKRLEDTLNNLRDEIYVIAESVSGNGGGGELTEGIFYKELNNAIASVDVTVEDGLKLDYRLRELTSLSEANAELSQKQLFMPYKYKVATPLEEFTVPFEEGIVFVDGEVTILNENGNPLIDDSGKIITGTIDIQGDIQLSSMPKESFISYFPVQMHLSDIPEDFLYLFANQMIQKNSKIMESVLTFEDKINSIVQDIEYMKGVNWTPDYSIMSNHREIIKERITPKSLHTEITDGMAHVTFSYVDDPSISHFILEKWDEEEKTFKPYDNNSGIVFK